MCQLLEVENQKVKKCTPRVWQRVGRRKKSKIALLRFLAVNPPPTLAAPNPLAWALFLFKMHLGAGNANWTGWVLLGKWANFIAPVLVFRFWLNYRWHSQGLMLSSVEMRIKCSQIWIKNVIIYSEMGNVFIMSSIIKYLLQHLSPKQNSIA